MTRNYDLRWWHNDGPEHFTKAEGEKPPPRVSRVNGLCGTCDGFGWVQRIYPWEKVRCPKCQPF